MPATPPEPVVIIPPDYVTGVQKELAVLRQEIVTLKSAARNEVVREARDLLKMAACNKRLNSGQMMVASMIVETLEAQCKQKTKKREYA